MSVATAQVLLFTACVYIEIVVKFVSEVTWKEVGARRLYVPQKHNAGKW